MKLGWRARRRWALVVLLVGLPLYIVVALVLVSLFDRPSPLVELGIYVTLGIAWALPLRRVFLSVGRADPGQGAERRDDAR
jgi:hypothetical protein